MKILEMRPKSYDERIDRISRGRVRAIKEAVAGEVPEGSHVLEIGCGTGELAALIIERDCTVEGFDLSPSMVRVAEERIKTDNLNGKFSVRQVGVEAMDGFAGENFYSVVSTLVFSELNDDERRFALKHAARILRPGGSIVIADEVVPQRAVRRLIHTFTRLPFVSGKSTHPIDDLAAEIGGAGFTVEKEVRSHGDSFAIVVGRKEERKDPS
jgi:demethylmenaquinone methyltransferase/2-methoxy-6-polyprenyl-1,4-benzoquinol methylase